MKALSLLVILITISIPCFSQAKRTPPKTSSSKASDVKEETTPIIEPIPATIRTQKDTFKGSLMALSLKEAKIHIDSGELVIQIKDIVSISFGDTTSPETTASKIPAQVVTAGREAIKALSKIKSLLETYDLRLVEAQSPTIEGEYDNAMLSIPDGELKNEIKRVYMYVYSIRLQLQLASLGGLKEEDADSPEGRKLIEAYKVEPKKSEKTGRMVISPGDVLRSLGKSAEDHMAKVMAMLNQ